MVRFAMTHPYSCASRKKSRSNKDIFKGSLLFLLISNSPSSCGFQNNQQQPSDRQGVHTNSTPTHLSSAPCGAFPRERSQCTTSRSLKPRQGDSHAKKSQDVWRPPLSENMQSPLVSLRKAHSALLGRLEARRAASQGPWCCKYACWAEVGWKAARPFYVNGRARPENSGRTK